VKKEREDNSDYPKTQKKQCLPLLKREKKLKGIT